MSAGSVSSPPKKIDNKLKGDFPHCLDGAPLLLPGSGNQLRFHIDWWLDKHRIHPHEIAEFDDSALMKAFGQKGAGIFIAPSAIDAEVEWQYQVMAIGRTEEVREQFYAISVERKISHSAVAAITETVREWLVPCCTAAQAEKEQKIGDCHYWHIRYVIHTLFPAKSSIRTYRAGNRNVAIDPRQALEGRSTLVQQYFIRSRIKS